MRCTKQLYNSTRHTAEKECASFCRFLNPTQHCCLLYSKSKRDKSQIYYSYSKQQHHVSPSGSKVERGIVAWNQTHQEAGGALESDEVYDLPFGISSFFQKSSWTRYIPFCPPRRPGLLDGYDANANSMDIKHLPQDQTSSHVIIAAASM